VGAVRLHDTELLKKFIDKGLDLDPTDCLGDTPLIAAAEFNNMIAGTMLLSRGADINAQSLMTAETALHVATAKGHAQMVEILLCAGANPNVKDSMGNTPLMGAVKVRRGDYLEIIELLLGHGADPYEADIDGAGGWNAFKWAETFHQQDVISLLQSHRKKKLE